MSKLIKLVAYTSFCLSAYKNYNIPAMPVADQVPHMCFCYSTFKNYIMEATILVVRLVISVFIILPINIVLKGQLS